jgi:hypothetical protein
MHQIARNATDPVDGFLRDKKFLVLDRDNTNRCPLIGSCSSTCVVIAAKPSIDFRMSVAPRAK